MALGARRSLKGRACPPTELLKQPAYTRFPDSVRAARNVSVRLSRELSLQPRASKIPVTLGRGYGNLQQVCGLLHA